MFPNRDAPVCAENGQMAHNADLYWK